MIYKYFHIEVNEKSESCLDCEIFLHYNPNNFVLRILTEKSAIFIDIYLF